MTRSSQSVSRRVFIAGSSAIGASSVLGVLFGSSNGSAKQWNVATHSAHQCATAHRHLSDKLTCMVADPSISVASTNLALRSTRCPHCNTQISAAYPAPHDSIGSTHV